MTQNGSAGISIERDIVFGTGGGDDLKCDVYTPAAGTSKRTAVIQLHGGGFRRGSKETGCYLAQHLVERGYVSIPSQYRFAPDNKWPAQIHDVKAAIRWTRANADRLGVDPQKIVILGHSAGGHLAVTAAGTPDQPGFEGEGGNVGVSTEVAACIALYSVPEIERAPDGSDHVLLPDSSDDEAYRRASSINHIGAGYPPTLLFHSTADATIPFEASMRFFQALRGVNALAEMHIFEGLSHVFDRHPEFATPMADIIDLFLDRHVVDPRSYPTFGAPAVAATTT